MDRAARLLHSGDSTVVVEFGKEVDIETNTKVNRLRQFFLDEKMEGIVDLLPAFCSLSIFYDPEIIRFRQVAQYCEDFLRRMESMAEEAARTKSRVLQIPILFGGEIGDELERVAEYHHLNTDELIERITSHLSRVYMIGFLPGLAYMRADNGLTMPRHATPRLSIPGGTFVVQKNQTNIMDRTSPTGWHPIGHTPVKQFDLNRESTFLFEPGDWTRFVSVSREEYEEIKEKAASGRYEVTISYEEVC